MSVTQTTRVQPIPFVAFNGNCAEAMQHYEKVFGGQIKVLMTGAQSPIADQMPPGFANRILHAELELPGGGTLYAGDCCPDMIYDGIRGISISLSYDSAEEAESIFNLLAEGGKVEMPFAPTFWAKKFGMVEDKFGVSWAINGELQSY